MSDEKTDSRGGRGKRSVAEERGEFTVGTHETTFGHVLEHGIDGGVIYMVLPSANGWRAYSHESGAGVYMKMPHQTYRKDVEDYLERHTRTREVAVLGVDVGEWRTVWVKDGEERAADNRGDLP